MSQSSLLGGERAARRSEGKDVDALGPSDSSDSGSDVQGEREMATRSDAPDELGGLPVGGNNDSDSTGTGERGSATGRDGPDGADITPDHVERHRGPDDALSAEDGLADDSVEGLATDDGADSQDDLFEEARPRRERHPA